MTRQRTLSPATIEWQENRPYTSSYGDIYFSSDRSSLLAEIDHVFLKPNRIEERLSHWMSPFHSPQGLQTQQTSHEPYPSLASTTASTLDTFTVGELGFGTGLNFLATADRFLKLLKDRKENENKRDKKGHKNLSFISFEKHPISAHDRVNLIELQKSLFPELEDLISTCCAALDDIQTNGIHRISFPTHAIQLTLVYGDINETAHQLSKALTQVDAWYLDGFAPKKNPDMWQSNLLHTLFELSAPSATFSTFTAASQVRRDLTSAGFIVQKVDGFGHKRDMLMGYKPNHPEKTTQPTQTATEDSYAEKRRSVEKNSSEEKNSYPEKQGYTETNNFTKKNCYTAKERPWFKMRIPSPCTPPTKSSDVIVIGSGLAGSACAYSLAKRGASVHLLERHPTLAAEASGNPMGALYTRFSPFDTAQNRLYQYAYLDATHHLNELEREGSTPFQWQQSSVIQLASTERERERQQQLLTANCWPASVVRAIDASEIETFSGFKPNFSGLLLPQGGWVAPPKLCDARVKTFPINITTETEAIELHQLKDATWEVKTAPGNRYQASTVVIANAIDAVQFSQTQYLPIKSIRGQITLLPATEASQKLSTLFCYEGYTGPAVDGWHTLGATFKPKSTTTQIEQADHEENIQGLKKTIPNLAKALGLMQKDPTPIRGRVAFRTQSPDYLPIAGPVPDIKAFQSDYELLSKGSRYSTFPEGQYLNGLYLSTAHGSKGVTTSNYCAELIAGYITGEPANTDQDVIEAIHPARFIIRDIMRRHSQAKKG